MTSKLANVIELEIVPGVVNYRFALPKRAPLKYETEIYKQSYIGKNPIIMQNVKIEHPPHIQHQLDEFYEKCRIEIADWVKEQNLIYENRRSENEKRLLAPLLDLNYYQLYERPKLNWTSEVFDFVLVSIAIDKKGEHKINKIYLFDIFKGPDNEVTSVPDYIWCESKTLKFLREKLYRRKTNGIDLKSKFRDSPEIIPIDSSIPVPITESIIKSVERDYYFNSHLNFELNPPIRGVFIGIHCKYGLLHLHTTETIANRMENIVHTGVMYRSVVEPGLRGPSWMCTLIRLLKENGDMARTARIFDPYIPGKWRKVIVD
jgi:hypothetical protein